MAWLKNKRISTLLEAHGVDDSACSKRGPLDDLTFAFFLEAHDDLRPASSLCDASEKFITLFSPGECAIVHCEILVPPSSAPCDGKTNFATYIGQTAQWQQAQSGVDYYLVANGARWRAVPILSANIANECRRQADANVGSRYSVTRYLTSARPLRGLAWMLNDSACAPGHCATITARVLKGTGANAFLPRHSAWYCPATLYDALNNAMVAQVAAARATGQGAVTDPECESTIRTLTQGELSYEAVRALGDKRCTSAVEALSARAFDIATDRATSRLVQMQLAQVLLRWTLLRSQD